MAQKQYIAIDLKSFYASVECVDRGLDPLTTNLVVADESRTSKTICLAVSPSMKAYGIPGRARLFEVIRKTEEVNSLRRMRAPGGKFAASTADAIMLNNDPSLAVDYIVAPPQMARYMQVSTQIYNIYLKYASEDDIHVYSIDEVFIDATDYLPVYGMTAREYAMMIILDVLKSTGITATAGIGTNLYLCKIAMDIEAKHIPPDSNGVRIAELDEMSYRKKLWEHRPITDFWRIGNGYAKKLAENGMYTMGDVALCSVGSKSCSHNENLLYKLFGVNAELLIDHAWGYEPCTIRDIKAFRPETNSISSGQVLQHPYSFEKGRLIVREMTDLLVLDLVEKRIVTNQMDLTVCYDTESEGAAEMTVDRYGRAVPKNAHGSIRLPSYTSSSKTILEAVTGLYERITDEKLLVRRVYVVAQNVVPENKAEEPCEQLSLFENTRQKDAERREERRRLERERRMQNAVIDIKKKYGKNAILKGMNYEEDATTRERNGQVGGHRA